MVLILVKMMHGGFHQTRFIIEEMAQAIFGHTALVTGK
jgi:hypothetical protein